MKLKLTLLPLCLLTLHAFAFEGIIKQNVKNYNGKGTNMTITWYLGAQNCRMDITASGKDINSNTVLIMDPASKTFKTFETTAAANAQKVYFQLKAADISGDVNVISVNKTGETKNIQGYNCEKWIIATTSGSCTSWITKDIDFDCAIYRDFLKSSVEIQALAAQGVKGFPIMTEGRDGANETSVDKITAQSISAESYAIPEGYTLFVPTQQAAPAKGTK